MKPNAILQDISVYYHKERRFWYLNSYAKTVDVVTNTYSENVMPSRMIKISSYLPSWGSRRYTKKCDALLDLPSWRGVVCEVLSKNYEVLLAGEGISSSTTAIANNSAPPRYFEANNASNDEEDFCQQRNVLQMQLEEQTRKVSSLEQQLEENSTTIAFLQHRLDEEMENVAALTLRLAEADCNRFLESLQPNKEAPEAFVAFHAATTNEEMQDFIAALNAHPSRAHRAVPLGDVSHVHGQVAIHRHPDMPGEYDAAFDDDELRDFMADVQEPTPLQMLGHQQGILEDDRNRSLNKRARHEEQQGGSQEEAAEATSLRLELDITKGLLAEMKARESQGRIAVAQARKARGIEMRKRNAKARPSGASPNSETYKRWFARQVASVSTYLQGYFGPTIWSRPSSTSRVDGIVDVGDNGNGFNSVLLGQILAELTRRHDGLLANFLDALEEQRGVNCYKTRLKEVEEATVAVVQGQLTSVAVLLLAHLGVSHAGYQTLINATSWIVDEDNNKGVSRVHCPLGTPMCRWPPLYKVMEGIKATTSALGLKNMGNGAAYMECKAVLVDQLRALRKAGLINLVEGDTIWVQILGDATGIWRSLKMNGTTIVLKVS